MTEITHCLKATKMLQKQWGRNKIAKTSQKLWPAEKHTSCWWGLEETITSICSFVKRETETKLWEPEMQDWDIYTSLSWGKTHLHCWSNLYASGYQRSDTMSINRRERSGRLRGDCIWCKGEGKRSHTDSPTVHCINLTVSKSCNMAIALLLYSHHHPWQHICKWHKSATINGCSSVAPRV